jgi:hypothetical protein
MDPRDELLHELALNVLDKASFPYVLIVGSGDHTEVTSHMMPEDRDMLKRWLKNGRWNALLKHHFSQTDS